MPNICHNWLRVQGDPEKLAFIKEAICMGKLCAATIQYMGAAPVPSIEHHFWKLEHWGTKWDIFDVEVVESGSESVEFLFSTAYSPPFAAFEALIQAGFSIEAEYLEQHMELCGRMTNDSKESKQGIYDDDAESLTKNLSRRLGENYEKSGLV